jgi:phosphohistidine phosphatase
MMTAPAIELLLVRHAHAGDPARWTGPDEERPLSRKGREQAARLGLLLAEVGIAVDVLLSSPKRRAIETAEILGLAIGRAVVEDPRLGGPLDLGGLTAVLAAVDGPARPLVVGHDPDLSDIATTLVGAPIELGKGTLVRIDIAGGGLEPGLGSLRWLLPAELLS